MRYFDTAPYYGHGLSEARVGQNLRWRPRQDYVLSTKVGRVLKPARRKDIDFKPWADGLPFRCRYDYSYDGTMRSFKIHCSGSGSNTSTSCSSMTPTCSPMGLRCRRSISSRRWTAATGR